jgi:hypothetical protein
VFFVVLGYLKAKICAIIFDIIVMQSTIVEHQEVRVIHFEITFTFVMHMLILILLVTCWSIMSHLEDA